MPRKSGLGGAWMLFTLGGLAAACGALAFRRPPSRGNLQASPGNPAAAGNPDPSPEIPDGASPPESSAMAPSGIEAAGLAGAEPWLEPLRLAMASDPHASGYGKSAWTAPLLVRYLQDTHGLEAAVPAVRKALKDLGYRWEHTRYVRAGAGALQEGSASGGMG